MTLHRFSYTLTPYARISAGRGAEVLNSRAVHGVLPGSVVRGALGSQWWRSPAHGGFAHPEPQRVFDAVFAEAMQVRHAVPEHEGRPAEFRPLTMVKCKYPTPTECWDEWVDTASSPVTVRTCLCGGGLEKGRGWDTSAFIESITRTELEHGVAATQQLFTRNALSSDLVLTGTITVSLASLTPEDADHVVEWLTTERQLSVGGQRSTMGRCLFTCTEAQPDPPTVDDVGYAVQLRAPAILVDDWGAPSLDLASAVARIVTAAGGSGTVTRDAVRPERVSGWHGMAGLPKPVEWAASAGSVAIVRDADSVTVEALQRGVGIRRSEGYGAVELVGLSTIASASQPAGPSPAPTPVPTTSSPQPDSTLADISSALTSHSGSPATGNDSSETSLVEPVADPPDPVREVLEWVPEADRLATISGMLAQARVIRGRREHGATDDLVAAHVRSLTSLPWMRNLAGLTQEQIQQVWVSPDLSSHITTLERLKDGEQ